MRANGKGVFTKKRNNGTYQNQVVNSKQCIMN